MLQTLNRAGRVLDLFTQERHEWGVTAVAQELGVAKSQAHELLASLAEIGLLHRERGRYRLGWRVVALHSLLWSTSDVGQAATRTMRTLAARCGETVQLAVWSGTSAVCVAGAEGRRERAVTVVPAGMGLPVHCTGPGKVLLASRPSAEIAALLAADRLERMTERTIATSDRLRAELAGVRRRGFAYDHEEHARGTCSVAAPIVQANGEVLAALSMSVPAQRWEACRDAYTRLTVASACHIARTVAGGRRLGDDGCEARLHRDPRVRPEPRAELR
jgi:DNA-binding IclR family transcriptional regulator